MFELHGFLADVARVWSALGGDRLASPDMARIFDFSNAVVHAGGETSDHPATQAHLREKNWKRA
jgi:hypothetical protein